MNLERTVRTALTETFRILSEADTVRVTTHCLYPSNGFVQVMVRGGIDTFFVSDGGGALQEIEAVGAEINNPDRLLRHLISAHGLHIQNGVITSPECNAASVGVAMMLVANASKEAADWLFEHTKIKRYRNFKAVVSEFLRSKYDDRVHKETLIGASNKAHKFENLIVLRDGKRLIVDPVIDDAGSINARVVANMDIRLAKYPDLEQRIVYDDSVAWEPENLNLLQAGASVIPFSRAADVIGRLANAV